ncbi:hypothetical protein [Solemya velesiana gill symbiont]|nr:hypothetical protein [Solemya velesiana gill symbiont]
MLKRITQSPFLNILSGLILLATAGNEIIETLGEPSIGAHHGIAIFGIIQILKAIPELMHGLKEAEEAKETLQGK